MTEVLKLDRDWNFRRCGAGHSATAWSHVDLPHCPFVADADGKGHWFGECEYRKTLRLATIQPGSRYVLAFGAAMHTARVSIDDREIGYHEGGYLPFEVDLTPYLRPGAGHVINVRLDNRYNADIPPGKPHEELDFCWYGGLYRKVELRIYPEVHITDAVSAGEVAGGGIFIRTLNASAERAVIHVKTHFRNSGNTPREVQVQVELERGNAVLPSASTPLRVLPSGEAIHSELQLVIERPALWSPQTPLLHEVRVSLRSAAGELLDQRVVRFGIRTIGFSRSRGFTINGQRLRLRGTNRHQEYPFAGHALPRSAQFRDARWIKNAGFDYVRLSHYPQSPDFLDACDELGIVVLNCIPGWQYIGGEAFRKNCYQLARELIRRDRNHACVVAWELSLNETAMDEAFMAQMHAIGHEEYPGDQMFTAGWIDRYDIYLHSRQHGAIHRWENGDKPMIIAEYGDWEFYASNEGFDQKTGAGVHADWSHSRQFRSGGERALRQQAWNHVIALNDTLSSAAVLDGQWAMFDYARGYHPVRAACGVMDIFRLPKFSYEFYRSQRDPSETRSDGGSGPTVFIASHWLPGSDLRVLVFSNCDEVELSLNGAIVARQKPSRTWMTQFLPHPPFVFDVPHFLTGTLEAKGWVGGKLVARHAVSTPGAPAQLELRVDRAGVETVAGCTDVLFAHAAVRDAQGNLCVEDTSVVTFSLLGQGEILGPQRVEAEAGIASIVLRLPAGSTQFALQAERAAPGAKLFGACHWNGATLIAEVGKSRPLQPA